MTNRDDHYIIISLYFFNLFLYYNIICNHCTHRWAGTPLLSILTPTPTPPVGTNIDMDMDRGMGMGILARSSASLLNAVGVGDKLIAENLVGREKKKNSIFKC